MSPASANLILCPDCGQVLKNHYRYCIRCGLKMVLEIPHSPDAALEASPSANEQGGLTPQADEADEAEDAQ